MIDRSTNIQASLRSRQRGFMLNPFRFGGGIPPGPFGYAAFLSGKSGDAWLADGTHYTDTSLTTVSGIGDPIGSMRGAAAQYSANNTISEEKPTLMSASGKRYVSFDGGDSLGAGSTSVWTYLHNAAGNGYICAAVRIGSVSDPNALYPIAGTFNGASSETGTLLIYDDRASLSMNNAGRLFVGRGVGGSMSATLDSASGDVSPMTDVILEFIKAGSSVSLLVNGSEKASGTLLSPSVSSSTYVLSIGSLPNGSAKMIGRLYGLMVCNAVPSAGERAAIIADMSSRCESPPI